MNLLNVRNVICDIGGVARAFEWRIAVNLGPGGMVQVSGYRNDLGNILPLSRNENGEAAAARKPEQYDVFGAGRLLPLRNGVIQSGNDFWGVAKRRPVIRIAGGQLFRR